MEDHLTNEKLRNKFANQFELVSYAIKIASGMIRTGRAPRVKTDTQNVSMNVLAEIAGGKDLLDDIIENVQVKNEMASVPHLEMSSREPASKPSDRKKSRIIH